MGLCSSHPVERDYDELVRRSLKPLRELFEILYIKPNEQRKMFECFDKMDKDGGRSISFEEFCWHFRIPQTRFSRRCFLLMDASGRGEMTLAQFIICAWNFNTYDKEGLATFAFNLYDIDGEGSISNEDMFTLVEESYDIDGSQRGGEFGGDLVKNSPEYMIRLAKAQIMTAAGLDRMMQLKEFLKFCITHPNLLKRAFTVQSKMQDEICGRPFWEKLTKRRRKMTRLNGKIVDWQSIDEIVEAFAGWDKTADLFESKRKRLRPVTSQGSSSKTHAEQSGPSVKLRSKSKLKNSKSRNKRHASAKKTDSKSSYVFVEEEPRVLPRKKSSEDIKFDAERARNGALKRSKRLKRKKSAETMQKWIRKRQAEQQMRRKREGKHSRISK